MNDYDELQLGESNPLHPNNRKEVEEEKQLDLERDNFIMSTHLLQLKQLMLKRLKIGAHSPEEKKLYNEIFGQYYEDLGILRLKDL